MDSFLTALHKSLIEKNWYAALTIALLLPDICSKIEHPKKYSSSRYPQWFDKFLGNSGKKYHGFLNGNDCYALRCALLHEGSDIIETQNAKDALDRFVFLTDGPHCNLIQNSFFGDQEFDGKSILQLSVRQFSEDIMLAVQEWMTINNNLIQSAKFLEISDQRTIGGLRIG